MSASPATGTWESWLEQAVLSCCGLRLGSRMGGTILQMSPAAAPARSRATPSPASPAWRRSANACPPATPLVPHGASSVPQEFVELCNRYGGKVGGARGVPEEMPRRAAGMSVCKINVDTDIRLALTASIRKHFAEHPEDFDPRACLKPAREAVRKMVAHKIRDVMGSSGRAQSASGHDGLKRHGRDATTIASRPFPWCGGRPDDGLPSDCGGG